MDGLRVLITRDRSSSEDFARQLEQLGALPVICPAIEIRYRTPPGLDEALHSLDRFDWLVLTSANAVRAVGERFNQLGLDPASMLRRTRVAVVGEATESEIERLGGRAEIVSSTGTGAGLAADLIAAGVFERLVLFPASLIARPELPARLREAGAGVIQFAVYETVAPEGLSVPGPASLDVATFTSPSAVRHVVEAVGSDWFQAVPVVCIGETTAATAREAGTLEPIIAPETSMAGILVSLLEFQQRRRQEVEYHGEQ